MEKYAVALKRQSRFAPTRVGEFVHSSEHDRHIWKDKTASNMAELAEQTNAAIDAIVDFNDPFLRIELVQVEKADPFPLSLLKNGEDVSPQHRKLNAVGTSACQTHEETTV